jgi:hypothetical protein
LFCFDSYSKQTNKASKSNKLPNNNQRLRVCVFFNRGFLSLLFYLFPSSSTINCYLESFKKEWNIERTGGMSGMGLNIEEISGLEVAMLQRKLEENLPGKMYFWGKVFGTTQDYLIVHNIDPYAVFPEKKYYFWYDYVI